MNTGLTIAAVGVALMVGAGGSWLFLHDGAPTIEEKAAKQDRQPFGPVPNVTVLEVKPAPPAPAPPPVVEPPAEEPKPAKAAHRAKPKQKKRPASAAKLSSEWGQHRRPQPQPQPVPLTLERLFNVR